MKVLGKNKACDTRLTLLWAVLVKSATVAKPVKCIVETTAGTVAFLLTVVLVLLDFTISAKHPTSSHNWQNSGYFENTNDTCL